MEYATYGVLMIEPQTHLATFNGLAKKWRCGSIGNRMRHLEPSWRLHQDKANP
jgi:hypothetical protein